MATAPLVPQQIETTLQQITSAMNLQLTADPNPPNNPFYGIRIGWQQDGQPAQKIDEDVIYIRAVTEDDQYNRVRDHKNVNTTDAEGNEIFQAVWTYTRIWRFFWECTGPNSFDNARQIRSSLFREVTRFQFGQVNLYFIPDDAEPTRVPEQRDGQWWPRTDFSARYNEFVTETYTSQSVLSTEIIIENSEGIISDITVEA